LAVDFGCGHGAITGRFADRVGDSGHVYAVDTSADQLRIARSALADPTNVAFVQGAMEDNPLHGKQGHWQGE
jgi:ubiquinone/menaquinone biosynthesis C-methylase UbiE